LIDASMENEMEPSVGFRTEPLSLLGFPNFDEFLTPMRVY